MVNIEIIGKKLMLLGIGVLIMLILNMMMYDLTLDDNINIYVWNILYLVILTVLVINYGNRSSDQNLKNALIKWNRIKKG